ncbi:hypothetical protein [uncultured Flavonifractor sp.]|uniref:hypothetical protein n=1 Tax=uncultured Flavonifractor sp. TaxID=1193534 RepID=UPI002599190A|nr:hypothetical protein [uncultured Flavonifractor sp.]
MSRFLYFGSVFAARFGAGKDLRITDSSQAGKAVWVAAEGKLISPSPYYLQFSPSFLTGEGLASGKIVAMDGGRYRCRLPILGPDWPQSPDLGLFKRLNGDRGEKDSLRFYAKSSLRSDDLVPVIIWPGPLDDRHIQVGAANSLATDRYLPRDFGFLPVLEPILDYAPEGLVGQRVCVMMPGDILRGRLVSHTPYELVMEVSPGEYPEEEDAFDGWGKWLEDGLVMLDRESMLNLYPQGRPGL